MDFSSEPEFEDNELFDIQVMTSRENNPANATENYNFSIELTEIKIIKQTSKSFGNSFIIIHLRDGTYLDPLIFWSKERLSLFLEQLDKVVPITQFRHGMWILDHKNTNTIPKEKKVLKESKPLSVNYSLGSFEVLGLDADEEHDIEEYPPLSKEEWLEAFDEKGRSIDEEHIISRIYHGGVSDDIRSEVWKFLLGYYEWSSTTLERIELDKRKEKEYNIYKSQWSSFTDIQLKQWKDFHSRIRKIGM